MPHGERIAEFLFDIGAIEISLSKIFTWTKASGIKSPIYCDNRMIYSHPRARSIVVGALADRIRSLESAPEAVAGVATAAIGWAALVADRLDVPLVYVRGEAKEHGKGKRIEGDLLSGKRVVVIEDILSTGGSATKVAKALREDAAALVTDIIAIMSYEFQESRERAEECGVHLHPLCTITTLLNVAERDGRIGREERSSVEEFLQNPREWRAYVAIT